MKKTYVASGHARVNLLVHEIYSFTYFLLSKYTLHNVQVGPSQHFVVDGLQCSATVAFSLISTVVVIIYITHPCASLTALAVV